MKVGIFFLFLLISSAFFVQDNSLDNKFEVISIDRTSLEFYYFIKVRKKGIFPKSYNILSYKSSKIVGEELRVNMVYKLNIKPIYSFASEILDGGDTVYHYVTDRAFVKVNNEVILSREVHPYVSSDLIGLRYNRLASN